MHSVTNEGHTALAVGLRMTGMEMRTEAEAERERVKELLRVAMGAKTKSVFGASKQGRLVWREYCRCAESGVADGGNDGEADAGAGQ